MLTGRRTDQIRTWSNSNGLAVDPTGLVVVGEFGNGRISVFRETGEFITWIGYACASTVDPASVAVVVGGGRRGGRGGIGG